jgi:hypothetical protein
LDQKRSGHKELIMMLILKNIQISQQENWILSIQLKELKSITDTAIHSMLKLDQTRNGHKELIMTLTHKNILISQPVNLIHLTQLKEQKNTTDIVIHLMHKYILNLNLTTNKVIQSSEVLMNSILNNLGKKN